jgi:acyl homoserine lactone synthase
MITIVDGLNRSEHEDLVRGMFRLRARTFSERLGWDVEVTNGEERDLFDDLHPSYVICTDDENQVVGCMRLLQTTGPCMLSEIFAPLLDGQPAPRGAQLWEATRFCIDIERLTRAPGSKLISRYASEVMIGAFEYAIEAGVTDAVAVIDPVMLRVMKHAGNGPSDYLGSPQQFGKVVAVAVLMDCTHDRIDRIRAHSGVDYDVFAPQVGTTTPARVLTAA